MLAAVVSLSPFEGRLRPGSGAAFVVLVSFLLAFLAIRTSARLTRSVSWWPGGVQAQGMHLHHLVWGICLMMLCGFLAFAAPLQTPWWHLVAVGFGIGMGFTLDEFALWVHLEDVYWTEQGRISFDAVVCSCAFGGLIVLGLRPFGLQDPTSIAVTGAIVLVVVGLSVACFAKGRVLLGVIGLFVPLLALLGTLRLARPNSPWARWRYDERKRRRAQARFAASQPLQRFGRRFQELVSGAPSDGDCPRKPPSPPRR